MNQRLNEYIGIINRRLSELVPECDFGEDIVHEAMKYSLSIGGKRIRPVLVLEFCRICGGSIEDAVDFACALEMVHTYSLIHDDLPCMDDDELRRGMPACHVKFGEAYALLAGDGLLTRAFGVLANSSVSRKNPTVAVNAVSALSYLSLLFVVVALLLEPNSKFLRYHINQSIVLQIFGVVAALVAIIPVIGWIVGCVASIAAVVFLIMGIVRAYKGQAKDLPLIGKYTVVYYN